MVICHSSSKKLIHTLSPPARSRCLLQLSTLLATRGKRWTKEAHSCAPRAHSYSPSSSVFSPRSLVAWNMLPSAPVSPPLLQLQAHSLQEASLGLGDVKPGHVPRHRGLANASCPLGLTAAQEPPGAPQQVRTTCRGLSSHARPPRAHACAHGRMSHLLNTGSFTAEFIPTPWQTFL